MLTLDAVTAQYPRSHAVTGDLEAVVTLDATTPGPRPGRGRGVRARRQRIRYGAEGKLELVLCLDGRARITDVIKREGEEPLLII